MTRTPKAKPQKVPGTALTRAQYDRAFLCHQVLEGTDIGQRFYEHLTEKFWEPMSFDLDPHAMAYNEGSRAVLKYLREQLRLWDTYGHTPVQEEHDDGAYDALKLIPGDAAAG